MAYIATTPWEYQTWGANKPWPDQYTRLSQRRIAGGTETGTINPFLTDIARGVTLIYIDGGIETTLYPYQNTLADADWYILGGHTQLITDEQAVILTAEGYGDYVRPAVPNVIGLTQAAATAAIIASGFIVGTETTTSQGATPANTGKVQAQSPTYDSDLAQGGKVNLVLYLYS